MSLVVVPHALRSLVRSRDWKDTATLYIRDLESAPRSVKVQDNAGWAFLLRGEAERALGHFDRAIELGKGPEWFVNPHRGRAYALWELDRRSEAREAHGVFVEHGGVDPRLDEALGGGGRVR
jgi:tetratricopeptide (TPR) repeat protein